ncbi:MAG: DUF4143 domain-containing protein, partial [Bifidobacteriaceae bacterium]|nr:DUF4143 domain-containing protein [Bifidobacteriaceae bacterium]
RLVEIAPSELIDGPTPRLLDEWQTAPTLWNLVRRQADAAAQPGSFLLTGSAVPRDDDTRHTGAGRLLRLRQRTLTWYEKSDSDSTGVSLARLFAGDDEIQSSLDQPSLGQVIARLLAPGFPALLGLPAPRGQRLLRAYAEETARADIRRVSDIRHDPEVVYALIRALARSAASQVSYATLAKDLRGLAPGIKLETVSLYVGLLRSLFVVEAQPAWAPRLRSRARSRQAAKLHLADPALAAAVLGASAERLARQPEFLGQLFESAATHDLMVFAQQLDGEVRHYRDSNGHEIDAIVSLPDGAWGAVEVKLGGPQVQAAARSLAAAVGQIDLAAVGEPAFRLVVTGTGPTLRLEDGTVTCPLTALRP